MCDVSRRSLRNRVRSESVTSSPEVMAVGCEKALGGEMSMWGPVVWAAVAGVASLDAGGVAPSADVATASFSRRAQKNLPKGPARIAGSSNRSPISAAPNIVIIK